MDTSFNRNPSGVPVASFAILFHDTARVVRRLAARVDAWFAARARAAHDRKDLASMSDRELADIGLYRGNFDVPARTPRAGDWRW
jgi:uncharacterized protein YjiS (DUF1127 family)